MCNTTRKSHLVSSEYSCDVSDKLKLPRQTDRCSKGYRLAEDCGQSRTPSTHHVTMLFPVERSGYKPISNFDAN